MSNYRTQTPQIISVLYRKLKPGQTFEDFQKAHLPPGEFHKTEFGYDVDYFDSPTRVINAVCATDPNMIISIGLTYAIQVLREVQTKIPLEELRHQNIAQVSEKVGSTELYFTAADNNYGKKEAPYSQLPLVEVTQEVLDNIKNMISNKTT